MFARIARQYRRFVLGSLLLTLLVGVGLGLGIAEWPNDMPGPIIFALAWVILLLLVIGTPIAVLSLLLPGLLPLIELWGIALILSAVFDPAFRILMTGLHLPGWTYCLYLVTLFICVERALYGPWLADFMPRDMKRRTAVFTCHGTPQQLWRTLIPDPAHHGEFYWPDAAFLPAPDGSDADFVLSLPRRGGYKDALLAIHVENAQPPARISYRADPLPGSGDPAHLIEIHIDPIDNGQCRITYSQQYLAVPLGKRLFYYLNHEFRDTLASLRARTAGRRDHSVQGLQMLRS